MAFPRTVKKMEVGSQTWTRGAGTLGRVMLERKERQGPAPGFLSNMKPVAPVSSLERHLRWAVCLCWCAGLGLEALLSMFYWGPGIFTFCFLIYVAMGTFWTPEMVTQEVPAVQEWPT